MPGNPIARIRAPRQSKKPPCIPSSEQLGRLLATVERSRTGVRDRAALFILVGCGLRVAELSGLRVQDLDAEGQTLTVLGKGQRWRVAHLDGPTVTALVTYLSTRATLAREDPLLAAAGGGHWQPRSIQSWLERSGRRAGLVAEGLKLHPHLLRRTFAQGFLTTHPQNIWLLKDLLGHSKLSTTELYVSNATRIPVPAGIGMIEWLGLGGS